MAHLPKLSRLPVKFPFPLHYSINGNPLSFDFPIFEEVSQPISLLFKDFLSVGIFLFFLHRVIALNFVAGCFVQSSPIYYTFTSFQFPRLKIRKATTACRE